MPEQEQKHLAIDIGGTHVKSGIVDRVGSITQYQKLHTKDWRVQGNFQEHLIELIKQTFAANPHIRRSVGIGVPGLIDRTRSKVLEVPAIPELNGIPLKKILLEAIPGCQFFLENDANAAAIGEQFFVIKNPKSSFIFVTLGTGVGGAAIIDGHYFSGGCGNPVELGHMLSRGMFRLEQIIGKQGILKMATDVIQKTAINSDFRLLLPVTVPAMIKSADEGNQVIIDIFHESGKILGEALVNIVRILDIHHIIVGGGISHAFRFIAPGVKDALNAHLTPYYLDDLVLEMATLGNDAGLVGAAVPCMK